MVNATIGSCLSSPLESPDIMQTFIPLCDVGATNTSMASIKLSSADSINIRSQQVRPFRIPSYCASTASYKLSTSSIPQATALANSSLSSFINVEMSDNNNSKSLSAIPEVVSEIPEIVATNSEKVIGPPETVTKKPTTLSFQISEQKQQHNHALVNSNLLKNEYHQRERLLNRPYVDFNLNSVGRSFIDEIDETLTNTSLNTPETPTPNISPSSSNRFSETFSNDFNKAPSTPSIIVSPIQETLKIPTASFCGSWDLLELDLDFHDVNFDPSYGGDLEECIFFGDDDPLGILPEHPTAPDAFDL